MRTNKGHTFSGARLHTDSIRTPDVLRGFLTAQRSTGDPSRARQIERATRDCDVCGRKALYRFYDGATGRNWGRCRTHKATSVGAA